jgi:hypothetical protein
MTTTQLHVVRYVEPTDCPAWCDPVDAGHDEGWTQHSCACADNGWALVVLD